MKRMNLALAATVFGLALSGLARAEDKPPHWTYTGEEGPEHWAEVAEDAGVCATGQEQSPVNLTHAMHADASALQRAWNPDAEWTVVNNGHTIQATSDNGGTMLLDGKEYKLVQFHFHHPAEHALDGQRSPMEVHFVHKADDGSLAVLGVMLMMDGAPGPLDEIMKVVPTIEGEVALGKLDLAKLLPANEHFFRYQGSLTTPPCSETVTWTVLQEPVAVSDAALAKFQNMFDMNARPLQPLNRRFILSN